MTAGQGAGGRGAVDRSVEALLDQIGQVAAVVDVGMAEQHRVDVAGPEGKFLVANAALGAMALEQSAVQQQRLAAGVNLVHRAGDGAGGTPEGDGGFGGRLALAGHDGEGFLEVVENARGHGRTGFYSECPRRRRATANRNGSDTGMSISCVRPETLRKSGLDLTAGCCDRSQP